MVYDKSFTEDFRKHTIVNRCFKGEGHRLVPDSQLKHIWHFGSFQTFITSFLDSFHWRLINILFICIYETTVIVSDRLHHHWSQKTAASISHNLRKNSDAVSFSILVFHSKLNTPCALLTKTVTFVTVAQMSACCIMPRCNANIRQRYLERMWKPKQQDILWTPCALLLLSDIAERLTCVKVFGGSLALLCQSFPFCAAREHLPMILIINILLAVVQETVVE